MDVYVYDDFDTDTTTLTNLQRTVLDNSFDEAGYHSVPLTPSLPVSAADDVVVVVKFSNATSTTPIAVDEDGPCQRGQTYVSRTGADGSWEDATAIVSREGRRNVAIRLRVSDLSERLPTPTPQPTPTPVPGLEVLHQFEGGDFLGYSVGGVGDINQDGTPDVVAGDVGA